MTGILDRFGLYIPHLENVATDTSYRAKEYNRIKGCLNKWKNSKMLVNLLLSGTSKTYHATIASKRKNRYSFCCHCSWKSQRKTTDVKKKDVKDFNQIKTMKKYTKELEDGKVEYKTVCLKNLQAELKKPVNVRRVKR